MTQAPPGALDPELIRRQLRRRRALRSGTGGHPHTHDAQGLTDESIKFRAWGSPGLKEVGGCGGSTPRRQRAISSVITPRTEGENSERAEQPASRSPEAVARLLVFVEPIRLSRPNPIRSAESRSSPPTRGRLSLAFGLVLRPVLLL